MLIVNKLLDKTQLQTKSFVLYTMGRGNLLQDILYIV